MNVRCAALPAREDEPVAALAGAGDREDAVEVALGVERDRAAGQRPPLAAAEPRLDRDELAGSPGTDAAEDLDDLARTLLHEERKPERRVHVRLLLAAVPSQAGLEPAALPRVVHQRILRVRGHARVAGGEPFGLAHVAGDPLERRRVRD